MFFDAGDDLVNVVGVVWFGEAEDVRSGLAVDRCFSDFDRRPGGHVADPARQAHRRGIIDRELRALGRAIADCSAHRLEIGGWRGGSHCLTTGSGTATVAL